MKIDNLITTGFIIRVIAIIVLLYTASSCEKDPIEPDMVPPTMTTTPAPPPKEDLTQPTPPTVTATPTTNVATPTTDVATPTADIKDEGTDTTTSTTEGTGPKTEAELNEEAEALDCSSTYIDYSETCEALDLANYDIIHRELGVRHGHTLRNPQSYYTDIYDTTKERVSQRFEDVVGHYPTIIEDNTDVGSYSFAGTCGTSWHDGSIVEPENIIGTLVHEWGHVWHSQLNLCEQETILNAFAIQREAYANGTGYPQILSNIGGTKENPVQGWDGQLYPYQLSNEGEYMACNIAAYFNSPRGAGTIQSRQHLMETDPMIYELLTQYIDY